MTKLYGGPFDKVIALGERLKGFNPDVGDMFALYGKELQYLGHELNRARYELEFIKDKLGLEIPSYLSSIAEEVKQNGN